MNAFAMAFVSAAFAASSAYMAAHGRHEGSFWFGLVATLAAASTRNLIGGML